MIPKPFDVITKADIDMLIADSIGESKTLEYKQQLPGPKDDDKKEFLADVSSFANASGGDILYGITAAVNEDGKKTGEPKAVVPLHGTTADQAKLRLEEVIRRGIDPRLRVQIKEITGWGDDGQGFIILLHMPKSFSSPHMVTFKGTSRFFSRNSAGKYQLDVTEIRSAILATDSQSKRIMRFRQDRLGQIVADETPVVLSSPHRLVLHLIPITSFLNNERLDLSDDSMLRTRFRPIRKEHLRDRYNLDGFVRWSAPYEEERGSKGYCQLFFNGAVEHVYADVVWEDGVSGTMEDMPFCWGKWVEEELIDAVELYMKMMKQLDLTLPVYVFLTLLGCRGTYAFVDKRTNSRLKAFGQFHPIDRDTVILPDAVIDSFDEKVSQKMSPIFNAVWNACGHPRR